MLASQHITRRQIPYQGSEGLGPSEMTSSKVLLVLCGRRNTLSPYSTQGKAKLRKHGTSIRTCNAVRLYVCRGIRGSSTGAFALQAPKAQASKEAKALAASNSSKGKKKVGQSSLAFLSTAASGLLSVPASPLSAQQRGLDRVWVVFHIHFILKLDEYLMSL